MIAIDKAWNSEVNIAACCMLVYMGEADMFAFFHLDQAIGLHSLI